MRAKDPAAAAAQAQQEQAWALSYAIAFASIVIAAEFRGSEARPEDVDQRARALADRATRTVCERLAGGGAG